METQYWGPQSQKCDAEHGIYFESDWPLGIAEYRYVVPIIPLMASLRKSRIPKVSSGSLRFLCLLAAFDQTPIPDFFWCPSPRFRDRVLRTYFKDEEAFVALIEPLEKAGLIRRSCQTTRLHQSLQITLRGILSGVISDSDGFQDFTPQESSALYWATRVVELTSIAYNEHSGEEGYFSEILLFQATWCIRLGRQFPILTEELAELQINFAGKIMGRGLVTEASQVYKDALAIQEQLFGQRNEKLINTLRSLGFISQISGNYVQALGFFERALGILGGPYGAFNLAMIHETADAAGQTDRLATFENILESIESVAEMCRDRGKLEIALTIYMRILELKALCTRGNDVRSADTFHDIGVTLHLMGKNEEALIGLQKALNIYQNEHANESRVATARHNIGMVYIEMGNHKEGFQFLKQSLEIGESYPKPSIDLAMKIGNMAVGFARLGQRAEALQWSHSALAMFQEFRSERTYVPAAQILHNIGLIELALGKRKLARKSLRLCIRILKNNVGGQHYKTRRAKSFLKTLPPKCKRHRPRRSERYRASCSGHSIRDGSKDAANNEQPGYQRIEHPDTLSNMSNFTEISQSPDQMKEAVEHEMAA